MPELPEVETTAQGLRDTVLGKTISDVWSDYNSAYYSGKENIKDPAYFQFFKKHLLGKTIVEVRRRAKQIFIVLNCGHIVSVHMKMTGHFLYGTYEWNKQTKRWQPPEGFWNKHWSIDKDTVKQSMPLSDPYNDFIHLMITFADGEQLAFSDMRKFATICLLKGDGDLVHATSHYGPEPLEKGMTFERFMKKLQTKPNMKIKTALLDQTLVAGFGNIYSDEVLWEVGVHPESRSGKVSEEDWRLIFTEGKKILRKALRHGGDSMGDYRKIDGRGGNFHNLHKVYQREGTNCLKPHCNGTIEKMQIDSRVGRFCPVHQIHY